MTQTGMMLGTMEYMSPEQAQGKDVEASSDIFTVGLILYELLAGDMPFYAESAIASLIKRTQQRAPPLTDIDKNIPGTLSKIVARCLEKDPLAATRAQPNWTRIFAPGKAGAETKVSAPARVLRISSTRRLPWKMVAARHCSSSPSQPPSPGTSSPGARPPNHSPTAPSRF